MTFRNSFFCVSSGFLWLVFYAFCTVSCAQFFSCASQNVERVTVMSYNAQTFFDAFESGTEFDEFKGNKSTWSAEKYSARLDRLKEVLLLGGRACGMAPNKSPDIVVLQEIENEAVVRDIVNRFQGSNTYAYAAFVPPDAQGAFSIAVLSRYRIDSVKAHQCESSGVSLRPLVEVSLSIDGKSCTVFAVHWKSKAGSSASEAGGARLRLAQEHLLWSRIKALESKPEGALWFACGDFNQTSEEFTVLNDYEFGLSEYAVQLGVEQLGSYQFNGVWEHIDHFFVSKLLQDGIAEEAKGFCIVSDAKIKTSSGAPFRFDVFSGKGYSDHLPVVMTIENWN